MRRGAVALLILLVALTTSGSVDAAPRLAGAPDHGVAPNCVRYAAGDTGMATSEDGTLTVHLGRWAFADGDGRHHGFEYRAWGPHTVTRRAGGTFDRWRGFSIAPIAAAEFCATAPGVPPIRI